MSGDRMPVGGSVIWWRLVKSTRLETLASGFKSMGLENYIPEPRTAMSCLRAALTDRYEVEDKKTERLVVRSVPKGFVVVKETPKDAKRAGDDWGEVVATVQLSEDEQDVLLDPWDHDIHAQIVGAMTEAKKWLSSGAVGGALVKIIEVWGLSLRPNGGVYWLPKDMVSCWDAVTNVVVTASAKTDGAGKDVDPNRVFKLNVEADTDMVEAIGDILTNEVEVELSRIEYELQSGNLGQRAIETREARAQHLLNKVAKYEESFQKKLEGLQEQFARSESAAAMAKLAAVVKAEQEQGVAA
jgi:hypothetical protein